MHTLRLALHTTKENCAVIEKRFHAIAHIHNVAVKHCITLLNQLRHDKMYQDLRSRYHTLLKKEKLSSVEKRQKKQLSEQLATIREQIGLTEQGLQAYLKPQAKKFQKCVSSQQVQKEATRVFRGVEKVLFGNGKQLHFKPFRTFNTISGKSNRNGVIFDKTDCSIRWIGLKLFCKLPKKQDAYFLESLDHDVSYCEIKRIPFPNGYHYYVILYLKGDAPKKNRVISDGVMGIDPGTSSMAAVSDTKVVLRELAPDVKRYNKQIRKLQASLELSRRLMNLNKYNADGTNKKGNRERWVFSKTYRKKRNRLAYLFAKKSAYIRQCHSELCNELLTDSKFFYVEHMDYKALQKRAKTTKRKKTSSFIQKSNGNIRLIYKYQKKKRFGKSMNNRAPAMFLSILKQKALLYGGQYVEIKTRVFKASQYRHDTDTYEKVSLSCRTKTIAGKNVQRDLYSAFLIKNTDSTLTHADRDKCLYEFEHFVTLQDEAIHRMKETNQSLKSVFGF